MVNDWFAELFEREMKKLGFKRVPVGPGQINERRRKKAGPRKKKSVTQRRSAGKPKSGVTAQGP